MRKIISLLMILSLAGSLHAQCRNNGGGRWGGFVGGAIGGMIGGAIAGGGNWNGGFYLGGIQVLSAYYGQNCGVFYDVRHHVQSSCANQSDCNYYIDHNRLGDPAYGCRKDFRVTYQCMNGQIRQAYAHGEASGQTILLSCW